MKPKKRNAVTRWMGPSLLLGLSSTFALGLGELVLRRLTGFPSAELFNTVPHDTLLYIMNPGFPGIDDRGFRNRSVEERYDIVAIGDSHTYGFNVESDEAWPAQLSRLLGRSVYNMGVGGYGVYQYSRLIASALSYNPSHVLIALYPANDLQAVDGCRMLASASWKGVIGSESLETTHCPEAPDLEPDSWSWKSPLRWLRDNSAFGTVAARVLTGRPESSPFSEPEVYDIVGDDFTINLHKRRTDRHFLLTNLDSDLNSGNFENSLSLFERSVQTVKDRGVHLGVLVVPSKERVVARWALRHQLAVPRAVLETVESEERLAELYAEFFEALGVPVVDATDSMTDLLGQTGSSAYKINDGHPLVDGYRVYAREAAKLLQWNAARGPNQ